MNKEEQIAEATTDLEEPDRGFVRRKAVSEPSTDGMDPAPLPETASSGPGW